VEISTDNLKSAFNKPMSPDEAIEAFKEYINRETRGGDRETFRIILK